MDSDPALRGAVDLMRTVTHHLPEDNLVRQVVTELVRADETTWAGALAAIDQLSGHMPESSREWAEHVGRSYMTILKHPEAGGQPEWVRRAWGGVSVPLLWLPDGRAQGQVEAPHGSVFDCHGREVEAPDVPIYEIHAVEGIISLVAEGRTEAAAWWLERYDYYQDQILIFPAEDCRMKLIGPTT